MKRGKKGKGKKKTFDTTQSSNPKLKYRQKEKTKDSTSLAEQTHKQKEPTIIVAIAAEGALADAKLKKDFSHRNSQHGGGAGAKDENVDMGDPGEGQEGASVPAGSWVETEIGGEVVGELGPTLEGIDGRDAGIVSVRDGDEDDGGGESEEAGDTDEGEEEVELGATGGGEEGEGEKAVLGGEEAVLGGTGVESDEEEKKALLAEENIQQIEEAEKVNIEHALTLKLLLTIAINYVITRSS